MVKKQQKGKYEDFLSAQTKFIIGLDVKKQLALLLI
jgi:hypothetical protein